MPKHIKNPVKKIKGKNIVHKIDPTSQMKLLQTGPTITTVYNHELASLSLAGESAQHQLSDYLQEQPVDGTMELISLLNEAERELQIFIQGKFEFKLKSRTEFLLRPNYDPWRMRFIN